MRLANEVDKGIIRAAAGVSASSTIAFLSSIADREAIAFGEAIATPMRMKFADISVCSDDLRHLQSPRSRCRSDRFEETRRAIARRRGVSASPATVPGHRQSEPV